MTEPPFLTPLGWLRYVQVMRASALRTYVTPGWDDLSDVPLHTLALRAVEAGANRNRALWELATGPESRPEDERWVLVDEALSAEGFGPVQIDGHDLWPAVRDVVAPGLVRAWESALGVVARDVDTTVPALVGRLRLRPVWNGWWDDGAVVPTVVLALDEGSRWGSSSPGLPPVTAAVELIYLLADEVQETVMEHEQRAWPTCRAHDLGTHVEEHGARVVWACHAGDGHVLAEVGALRSG
jgi:hypothetical protein